MIERTCRKARFVRAGDLGALVLDAPPLNLFDMELIEDLDCAINEARRSPIRALVVRSEGENFSAGADVSIFEGMSARQAAEEFSAALPMLSALERFPFPTLAVVQGLCLGGGLELALRCDLIWAAENAQLGLVEAAIGAFPFAGGVPRLSARVGATRAKEMIYDARIYPAAKMKDWGLVNRTLPRDLLLEKATAYAIRLAAGPTLAIGAVKELMAASTSKSLAAADELIPQLAARVIASRDLQAGVASLLAQGPGQVHFANG